MRTYYLYAFIFLLFCQHSVAQSIKIEDFFKSFISSINNITDSNSLVNVAQYLSDDYQSNATYIGLKNEVLENKQTKTEFLAGLQGILSAEQATINLSINNISNVSQDDSKATISGNIIMHLYINDKLAEKNTFDVTMLAKKIEDNWKFVLNRSTRSVEERISGRCTCLLYERENRYVTELMYPTGFNYSKSLDLFAVKDKMDHRLIMHNGHEYRWNIDGQLIDEAYNTLGKATDAQAAIRLILAKLFEQNCFLIEIF